MAQPGDDPVETLLATKRDERASPMDAIKAMRERFGFSLSEAKRRLHVSRAWADLAPGFEAGHDAAEQALNDRDQAV